MTDNLPERVGAIESKLDALSSSVDKRFDAVDERFTDVTAAIVEQREYTEFAFGRLREEMIQRFDRVEQTMATRAQLERLRLGTAEHFQHLETRFDNLETRFTNLETKLDRFLESQSRRSRRPRPTKKG